MILIVRVYRVVVLDEKVAVCQDGKPVAGRQGRASGRMQRYLAAYIVAHTVRLLNNLGPIRIAGHDKKMAVAVRRQIDDAGARDRVREVRDVSPTRAVIIRGDADDIGGAEAIGQLGVINEIASQKELDAAAVVCSQFGAIGNETAEDRVCVKIDRFDHTVPEGRLIGNTNSVGLATPPIPMKATADANVRASPPVFPNMRVLWS